MGSITASEELDRTVNFEIQTLDNISETERMRETAFHESAHPISRTSRPPMVGEVQEVRFPPRIPTYLTEGRLVDVDPATTELRIEDLLDQNPGIRTFMQGEFVLGNRFEAIVQTQLISDERLPTFAPELQRNLL